MCRRDHPLGAWQIDVIVVLAPPIDREPTILAGALEIRIQPDGFPCCEPPPAVISDPDAVDAFRTDDRSWRGARGFDDGPSDSRNRLETFEAASSNRDGIGSTDRSVIPSAAIPTGNEGARLPVVPARAPVGRRLYGCIRPPATGSAHHTRGVLCAVGVEPDASVPTGPNHLVAVEDTAAPAW